MIGSDTRSPYRRRPATVTLAAAFARYTAMKARKKTLAEDQRHARHLLGALGADTPLAGLTAAAISAYKAGRIAATHRFTGEPLSAAAINRPLAFLRSVLIMAAEEWDILAAVPKIKLEPEPQGRIRWLALDEETRLLEACRRSSIAHLHDLVVIALETGMRKGELLGMTWDRVDLSRGVIRLEVTKSGKRREIPMRQRVYDILAAMPHREDGRVWPTVGIRKAFVRATRQARVDDFHFHDLRHTFASRFMMNGGDLLALSKLLGHASVKMTERYSHLSQDHLREQMARTESRAEIGHMAAVTVRQTPENIEAASQDSLMLNHEAELERFGAGWRSP